MCGWFALFASGDEVAERFQLTEMPLFDPRYNIAPTQPVAAVRATAAGLTLAFLRWGLIPSWSSDLLRNWYPERIRYFLSILRTVTPRLTLPFTASTATAMILPVASRITSSFAVRPWFLKLLT